MLLRFRDLPCSLRLSAQRCFLLAFLDQEFFLRHRRGKPPKPYTKGTVKNVLRGGKKGGNCLGLEQRAGVEHVENKLMHRFKHGAMRCHIDALGDEDAAHRNAKHSGKVHEASYSNRTWCPKIAMAKVAGHSGGLIQLYRAGIWCSIEKDAAFKGLFDRITPVSDERLAAAERLLEGRSTWAGVHGAAQLHRHHPAGPGGVDQPSRHGT